jgi:hypothetical protein
MVNLHTLHLNTVQLVHVERDHGLEIDFLYCTV